MNENEQELTEQIAKVTEAIEETLRPIINQVRCEFPELITDDEVRRMASRCPKIKRRLKELKDKRRDYQAELNRIKQRRLSRR